MNRKRWKMREERAIALAIIGITILATLAMLPVSAVATNGVSVTYRFDESEILSWLDTGTPMKNLRVEAIAGEPLLPYRIANILLPPYTEVADVSVQATFGGQHIVNNSDVPCGQPACVIGEEPTIVEKNSEIYDSDELYPEIIYRVGSVVSFRGYNILHVRLYPVQYKLASNLAMYYTEMTVQVTLNTGYTMDTFRSIAKDRQIAENLIDNPWTLITYDNVPATIETHATTYEYLIITKAPLSDEFQVLADWKANWVDGAKVETVSANASAEEIKNIINDYYTNHGTSYVLLGGDTGVIPHHIKDVMFEISAGIGWAHIAEDYWFANLVGDDDISYYEVYIGRAPVDNETEATHFVNKVITFEQMDKPKANLFHQARLWPYNDPDSRELAWLCQQYVPEGYTHYELFEENGTIEKTDWRDFWRNDGIMCQHIGHGLHNYYEINGDPGYNVCWYDTDVPSMDNTFWPLHTSVACLSGVFWGMDCLAEAYVKADNGAIACFMNSHLGLTDPSDATMYSGDFVEMQFHALYQEGYQNIGAILAHSKHHFINEATRPTNDPSNHEWEWCWREINLIGDPETPMLTKRVLPVGYWRFNEGDGSTARDSSIFGNDGTIHGADWTAGRTGYALSFDGLFDYVKVPDSGSLDITDEITIAAWVNLQADHDTSMATMIRKQGNFLLELGNTGNNRPAFKLWFTDGTEIRLDGPEFPKFEWHHLAATYDGNIMKLYIDGNLVANCSVSKSIATSDSSLKIGFWGIQWFKGIIDEVRIYDLALPAEEIAQIVHGTVYYLSTNNIRIVVDSTAHDDPDVQTHALTIDNPIPKEFWTGEWHDANPDAIIGTADWHLNYEKNVSLPEGRHVLEYAVSNYVGYWHTTITMNGLVVADENTDIHNHIYVEFYVWPADIMGDTPGSPPDGDVDAYDLGAFADAYGTEIGDPNYNPRCDFMGDDNGTPPDGDVDAYDLGAFAQHYGKSYT